MENTVTAMGNVVTALNTSAGATELWGTFGEAIPYIAGTMLFAFGFFLIRRITRRGTKGKGGI